MINLENIIIVGAGPAGLSAGIYATRSMLQPLIISGPCLGGQLTLTPEIENYPGFINGIQGYELMECMKKQAIRLGSRIMMDSVELIDMYEVPFHIISTSGKIFVTNCLIIATGCEPKTLNLKDENALIGRGISTCATCDGYFYKNKKVVVVGGGDTAVTDALYLSRIAKHIIILCRGKKLSCEKALQDKIFKCNNTSIMYNSNILKYIVNNNKLQGIKAKGNKNEMLFKLDGIFMAIGLKPRTNMCLNLRKNKLGYIITETNNSVKTNVLGVFVAGDIINSNYKQAVIAASSGCIASIEAEKFLCI